MCDSHHFPAAQTFTACLTREESQRGVYVRACTCARKRANVCVRVQASKHMRIRDATRCSRSNTANNYPLSTTLSDAVNVFFKTAQTEPPNKKNGKAVLYRHRRRVLLLN